MDQDLIEKIDSFKLPSPLGFGAVFAPIMAQANYKDGEWGELELRPFEKLSLDPSVKVFHYGQQIFEGMKAYRCNDKNPSLFRPLENFNRFNNSARRMAMPAVPQNIFLPSLERMVKYLVPMIPQGRGESLYLRPFMLATDSGLGLAASASYLFLVIASPSGAYFSQSKVSALIERRDCRAATGGTGFAKVAGNYGSSILSSIVAKEKGYQQTLWLDAQKKRYIEEFSGMNFFAVIEGELYTPSLTDSILAGVTRDSILTLAQELGIKTHEVRLDINEIVSKIQNKQCSEIFACGTAAVITPVSELGEEGGDRYLLEHSFGPIAQKLRDTLLDIQYGERSESNGWVHEIKLD